MKREIITLVGSTRFKEQFREAERKLTTDGKIVLPLAFYEKVEGIKHAPEMLKLLFDLQLDKINLSDSVFVIDVDGYIGETTKREIDYARSKGKLIRFYSKEFGDKK